MPQLTINLQYTQYEVLRDVSEALNMHNSFNEIEDSHRPPWEGIQKKPLKFGKPWDFEDLLAEKNLTGLFLTGHPMELYQQENKIFSTANLINWKNPCD